MKLRYIFTIMVLMALSYSCTDEFEEINTNPNDPTSATPDLIFRNVLWEVSNNYAIDGWEIGNKLAQQTTNHDFNDVDRYDRLQNQSLWDAYYLALRNINNIEKQIEENSAFEVYSGPAKVMKAFIISVLTDMWGDVPYAQAGLADEFQLSPEFDNQENIYTGAEGILALLEEASSDIASYSGGTSLGGDIIYGGDLSNWQKLANSLRMRYLLRASDQVTNAGAQIAGIVSSGIYLTTNAENAKVAYLDGVEANKWYFSQTREGDYTLMLMAEPMEVALTNWNDPRISEMFLPAANSGTFSGLVSGINETWKATNGFNVEDYSLLGSRYRNFADRHEAMIMNAAEVQFILAEARQAGLISSSTVDAYYQTGITLAFDYLEVDLPVDYFTRATVDLAQVADPAMAIGKQKWVANFGVGYENFFDLRRWAWLDFSPAVANVNSNQFPVRFLYPTSEQATNNANYQSAVAIQGADDINTDIWLTK